MAQAKQSNMLLPEKCEKFGLGGQLWGVMWSVKGQNIESTCTCVHVVYIHVTVPVPVLVYMYTHTYIHTYMYMVHTSCIQNIRKNTQCNVVLVS